MFILPVHRTSSTGLRSTSRVWVHRIQHSGMSAASSGGQDDVSTDAESRLWPR